MLYVSNFQNIEVLFWHVKQKEIQISSQGPTFFLEIFNILLQEEGEGGQVLFASTVKSDLVLAY